MSLKAFHLVFIIASIALTVVFGAWSFMSYREPGGSVWYLVSTIGCAVAVVGLVFYERYFLKKFKNVSYL
jgi:hypothetical protein